MKKDVGICWLRRDLRLNDNAALYHALKSPNPVLVVFIFDKNILEKLSDRSDKRVAFIHQTLEKMNNELMANGSSMYVAHDTPQHAFATISEKFNVQNVYTNRDYEPYGIARDAEIEELLAQKNIGFHTYKDQVIFEKSEVMKSDGSPYTVFTPYSKIWKEKFRELNIEAYPSEVHFSNLLKTELFVFPSLSDIGFHDIVVSIQAMYIDESTIKKYNDTRNLPAVDGTSHTSIHLRFGTVSVRQLVLLAKKWNEQFLNELIWREFFMMILFHYPHVVNQSFKAKYDFIAWRNNEEEFERWCKGETGYPLVDAGMRQLNETGWMHNRVRMVVASFLTKHLLIDWRWGEAYFAEKLLDYELSANNGNWQWASGSGCDSAPYFRIFNPETQLKKFDPNLAYIKKWIKDYKPSYVMPMVAHDFARKRALSVYKASLSEQEKLPTLFD